MFLPVGGEDQDGIVVRFTEWRAGEDLICILEGSIAIVEGLSSASTAISMLIGFQEPFPQIALLKSTATINAASDMWFPVCPVKFFEGRRGIGLRGDIDCCGYY